MHPVAHLLRSFALAAFFMFFTFASAAESPRTTQSLDADCLFSRGDVPASETPLFDDVNWRSVDVPHDWAIEGGVDKDAPTGRGGGYRPSGVSWYRKRFSLPAATAGKRVFVEFDGVMGNSTVWINGQKLGTRPSGYVSFFYDLTGRLELGDDKTNILAVRTDTSEQPASRWYTGQGIYRHVRLVVTDPVHVSQWGLTVTTPKIEPARALVRVRANVLNSDARARDVSVHVTLLDPSGRPVGSADVAAQHIGIGECADFSADISVVQPELWDIGAGKIYRAIATVSMDGKPVDEDAVSFGIREARFEAATGFWLNGRNIKIKGVALHHDGGAVGAAVPLAVWQRRLERLRELGVNAIRTAHNPPAPDFLDLCDRMGFLVMDEFFDAWTVGKPSAEKGLNTFFSEWGEHDERDTLRRDRNHPGIILWSTGNEIHDTPNATLAKNILAGLVGLAHTEDPTRPVTQALFRPNTSHDFDDGLADMLDVIGTNYRDQELLAAQKAKPTRKIIGTEQDHERRTWLFARDNASHSGQFLWAGVDYLGEADWPFVTSSAGMLDRTGRFKPRAFERQSWWSDAPMVRIARQEVSLANADPRRRPGFDRVCNWTPRDPATEKEAVVDVYSNGEEVELTLNGKSLGAKARPDDGSPREWRVPFEPGSIRAVAKNGGKIVATDELRTAGTPAKLLLAVDRKRLAHDWDDVAFVTVTAVDANGVPCPWADALVSFKIDGAGVIAAVDNGDRADPAPYQATERRLFQGECLALVKANADSGDIVLTASAPGLPDATVKIAASSAR
ncbi:MAG TPA: glycoside hydrolase family 2 TIM barrel-domain containing protein [Candidatus Didemnitutus sp.]|nr:glycoside hydrolase family 2 TIM barrel-domain containing protein [Candidatus Didemnitutus sp.]